MNRLLLAIYKMQRVCKWLMEFFHRVVVRRGAAIIKNYKLRIFQCGVLDLTFMDVDSEEKLSEQI